jgi:pimeloyl-ACP methyl ester carboxylesterase
VARFESIRGSYVYVQVQNVEYRIYYEENGRGIPLLCQHTAGTDGQQWRHLLNDPDVISQYRVIVPDLPFHGKSLPPESEEWWKEEYKLTRSFFVDFIVEFSLALGLERPVFIGACMSGCLTPHLALEHPDKFRALIGLECALSADETPLDLWDHPRISNHFKAASIWSLMAPSSPEKCRREAVWKFSQGAPEVMKGDFYYLFKEHNLTGQALPIDTARLPLYFLTGEYDAVVPLEDTRRMAAQIPGARFVEMKGLGHISVCENPEVLKGYLWPILLEIAAGKSPK